MSDILNTTVAQGIAWLLSVGIVGFVAYGVAYLPFSDFWKGVITKVATAALVAGVAALATFIPADFSALKLVDAAFVVVTLIVGAIGTIKIGTLKAAEHIAALKARGL